MTPATRDDTQRALDALRDKTLEDKEDQGLLNAAIWLLELAGETRGGGFGPRFFGGSDD